MVAQHVAKSERGTTGLSDALFIVLMALSYFAAYFLGEKIGARIEGKRILGALEIIAQQATESEKLRLDYIHGHPAEDDVK
jgi:hypothetical protein